MATTKDDYSPTKSKTTTVATQTAAAQAAAAKAASIRAAQAAEARAKANSAIAAAEAKAKVKYTPPPTTTKTVGTLPVRLPTPAAAPSTVVNPASMGPSPAELAAQAAAQNYAQVLEDAAAREAAIKSSPTMAPAPPSSNAVGPYNPYIPSSGAVVTPSVTVNPNSMSPALSDLQALANMQNYLKTTASVPPIPDQATVSQGHGEAAIQVANLLSLVPEGRWGTLGIEQAYNKALTEGSEYSWQQKESKAMEAWIKSGYKPELLPPSMSPMTGYMYGLTEEQRVGLGYAPLNSPTKPMTGIDYEWPYTVPLPVGYTYDGSGSDTSTETGGELNLEQPVLPDITWEAKYTVDGAPSWWRGFVPSRNDPQSEYATMLNAMIPFMSPEDQRYTASMLYRLYPDTFASYNPLTQGMPAIPTDMTTSIRQYMTSAQRANSVLDTLNKVKSVSASDTKFGPGYAYLQQLGSLLRDFGNAAGNGQTRQQYEQFASAYDPLAAETKQEDLAAFSELTRMLAQPYYSAGKITPTSTLSNGQVIPGEVNKSWF